MRIFKIVYATIISLALICFVYLRFEYFIADKQTFIDIVAVAVLLVLVLMPLYSQIDLFGFKLFKEIKDGQEQIRDELFTLKNNIENQNIMNISLGDLPSTREEIQKLKTSIESFEKKIGSGDENIQNSENIIGKLGDKEAYVINLRIVLERELKRLAEEFDLSGIKYRPAGYLLNTLVHKEVIPKSLAVTAYDVYKLCSSVVHGRKINKEQYDFLQTSGMKLIKLLREVNAS